MLKKIIGGVVLFVLIMIYVGFVSYFSAGKEPGPRSEFLTRTLSPLLLLIPLSLTLLSRKQPRLVLTPALLILGFSVIFWAILAWP